jgi:hypothetical protein
MTMLRRDFCKALPALATLPLFLPRAASAAHVKITDVRLIKIRLVKDMGIVPRRVGATGGGLPITIGGFTMTEVHTDQGLVGLGRASIRNISRESRTSLSAKIRSI